MWRTVKLGDVCSIKTGKKDVNEGNPSGKYPFFTCAKEHTYSDEYSFECEAILIAGNGAVGQTTYYKGKFEAYQRTYVLTDFHSLLPKLLVFILQGRLMPHLNSMVLGNTIPYIKKGMLQDFEIPVPPLAEQQRIVAKLDAAFAEIDRAIELEYQKSFSATALESQAMTGWLAQHSSQSAIYKISDVVDNGWIQAPFDGNHGEIHPKAKDYVASGVPFLMASDIRNGHADLKNCKFLTRELADNLRKGFAKDRDVLLTHKGTVGEAAILSCELDYVMLTPQVTAYRVLNDGRISRDFLYYQFKSEYFQRQIRDIAGIGTTRAYIGITRQKELELYLPPIELQNEMVKLMQTFEPSVNQLSRVANKKIAELSYLKSAILAQELQPPQSEAA